jgi:phosphatidylglycerol---prolipoprotein diacylglyceryl transferase
MHFPVYIHLGDWQVHPHVLFESLGYAIALRLAMANFRRDTTLHPTQRSSIVVGGLVGGLLGAKLLVLLQHLDLAAPAWDQFLGLLLQGKTVVGGLLGAVAGVEVTKRWIGVKQSTGDAFVYPLLWGMAIGRIGCFLTGLSDRTYGIATTLPWGVDFGDGISRHPTQLYEILFLMGLGVGLRWRDRYPHQSGDGFKFYMIAYLSFRLGMDWLKPDFHPILGMSAIQIACLLGLIYYRHSFKDLIPLGIGRPHP